MFLHVVIKVVGEGERKKCYQEEGMEKYMHEKEEINE